MWDYIKNAFNIFFQNKMRTFLTMLGIIIGIASVIIIISVGEGTQSLVINQIQSQGSNLIAVFPGNSDDDGPPVSVMGIVITTLKYDEIVSMRDNDQLPHVKETVAYVQGTDTLNWQGNKMDSTFVGTSYSMPLLDDSKMYLGDFFSEEDEKTLEKKVVIGYDVWKELFGDKNPIGESIKIKKSNFKVIGVFEKKNAGGFANVNKQIFVPITTAQQILLGINYVSYARMKIDDVKNIDTSIEDIKYYLRDKHDIAKNEPDDFKVNSQKNAIETLTTITDTITWFLAGVGALALLVGGIGIMNIMLASVQERTREIGLRKAVGAKNKQILLQFLIETIILTITAGIIGILFGIFVSFLIAKIASYFGYDWDFSVSVLAVFVSVGISTLVGYLSGILPALRAGKLNPIEALRYE
ncbi:MAG: ABC transporter permease [Patescibacteria group bacterium]